MANEEFLDVILDAALGRLAEDRPTRELMRAGSVMAKPPRETGRLGITGDVIQRMLETLNPMEWMGGGAAKGAAFGPIGRSAIPALARGQKKMAKSIFRGGGPEMMREIAERPETLMLQPLPQPRNPKEQKLIDEVLGRAFAHFQQGREGSGTLRIDPDVLKGQVPSRLTNPFRPSKGALMKSEGIEGVPDIAAHEARHFLTRAQGLPEHEPAKKLAEALVPFLGHTKYGTNVVSRAIHSNPQQALNEAISYLSQPTGRTEQAQRIYEMVRQAMAGRAAPSIKRPESILEQDVLDALTSAFGR